MRKVIFEQPFQIKGLDTQIPAINKNQVLIKVVYVGLCGSDIHTYHGKHPTRTRYPLEFGHEVSGVVVKVGECVNHLQVGDRVTVEPQQYCGTCMFCKKGQINICRQAKGSSIFMAEYAAVDGYMVYRCPQDMPFDQIALIEPIAVGVASVKHCDYKHAKICVVGGGTIGNLAAQAACRLGAADVLMTDLVEEKVAYGKRSGIPHCVNTSVTGLEEAIKGCFGEDGADVIIDAAASVKGFEEILRASRPGSQIVITGTYSQMVEFAPPQIQRREIALIGHHMYVPRDFKKALELLSGGEIYTEGFIDRFFDLDEVGKAFEYIDKNRGLPMKVMIHVGTPEWNETDRGLMAV